MLEGLFPKTKMQILTLLLSHPDEWFYNRQIKDAVGLGQGAVQRELTRLLETGFIESERKGNHVYYRVNRNNPVYPELHMLIIKTTGLADHLRKALEPFYDRIRFAYIYGSFADGTANAESDVDLMVVGDTGLRPVSGSLAKLSRELSRRINPTTYTVNEYTQQLSTQDSFVNRVHHGPKIILIGDIDGS